MEIILRNMDDNTDDKKAVIELEHPFPRRFSPAQADEVLLNKFLPVIKEKIDKQELDNITLIEFRSFSEYITGGFKYTYRKNKFSDFSIHSIDKYKGVDRDGLQLTTQYDIDFDGKIRDTVETKTLYKNGRLMREHIWYDGLQIRKQFDKNNSFHNIQSKTNEDGSIDLNFYDHGFLNEEKTKKAQRLLKRIQWADNKLKFFGIKHREIHPLELADRQAIHVRNKFAL